MKHKHGYRTHAMNTPSEVFSTIYQSGLWSPEPWSSGPGSDPDGEGRDYCLIIPAILKAMGAKRVVDLGCGDGRIMARLAEQCPGIEFVGLDCCPEVIARNAATWPQLRFEVDDLSEIDTFPHADVYLSKDVLHHWPEYAIKRLLRLMDSHGTGFAFIATQDSQNAIAGFCDNDCELGGYRPLSAETEPLASFAPIVLARYLHKSILMFRYD